MLRITSVGMTACSLAFFSEESIENSPAKRLNYDHAHTTWFSILELMSYLHVTARLMRMKGKDTSRPEQGNEASVQHWHLLKRSCVISREFVRRKEHQTMNVCRCLLNTTCLFAVFFASGCIIISGETVEVEIEEIEIDSPPPEAPTEVVARPARPGRHHVWIGGHHIVHAGTWVWVHGHWVRPPHEGATWMPCHTRRKSEIWVWTPGYWR